MGRIDLPSHADTTALLAQREKKQRSPVRRRRRDNNRDAPPDYPGLPSPDADEADYLEAVLNCLAWGIGRSAQDASYTAFARMLLSAPKLQARFANLAKPERRSLWEVDADERAKRMAEAARYMPDEALEAAVREHELRKALADSE